MEFVDDLADPNGDKQSALASNDVLQAIQHEKRLTFSAEKCELLKINSKDNYLRNVLKVSKATQIAAMHLKLGILTVRYEIEMRQLLFLKRLLDKSMLILVYVKRCLNLRMKQIRQIMYLVYGETIIFP